MLCGFIEWIRLNRVSVVVISRNVEVCSSLLLIIVIMVVIYSIEVMMKLLFRVKIIVSLGRLCLFSVVVIVVSCFGVI